MLPIKLKLVWGCLPLLQQHKIEKKIHTLAQTWLLPCIEPTAIILWMCKSLAIALGESSMDMHKGQFPYVPPSHYIHPSTKE
jgi:hypothetical protein